MPGLSSAAPKDPDPVREGVAPVTESDWWYDAMRLDEAHQQTTGAGVTIALLEDTLDPTVPELRGTKVERGPGCSYEDREKSHVVPRARDPRVAHGTSMAALMVGNGRGTDGGRGLRGVAPGATVRLYSTESIEYEEPHGCMAPDGADSVMDPVLAEDADIVNMSFGFGWYEAWQPLLDEAMRQDKVLVAGLPTVDDPDLYPHGYPGVVAVAAADRDAKPWVAQYTKKGAAEPTVAAPGVEVGTGVIDKNGWRSDVWHDGASSATAIVSGSLALVKSKYPDSTANQLIQHLIHNTGGDRGYRWDAKLGFGITSVTKMLETSPTQWPDENPLLKGPQWAIHDYPMWSSSLIDAPPEADDKWAKAERAKDEASAAGGERAAEEPKDADPDGGVPVWVWPVGGAAALLVAVLIVLRLRSRTGE